MQINYIRKCPQVSYTYETQYCRSQAPPPASQLHQHFGFTKPGLLHTVQVSTHN